MAILNFNYNQAINQANQINTIAIDMLSVANKELQSSIDSLGASWQGEASQQFIEYCAITQDDIRAQSESLKNLAERMKEVARIIKEAEDRARELQRQREAAERAKALQIQQEAMKSLSTPKLPTSNTKK